MMRGWKTWAGVILVAASAVLRYLGYTELADAVVAIGVALGVYGIGHKVEKHGV